MELEPFGTKPRGIRGNVRVFLNSTFVSVHANVSGDSTSKKFQL